MDILIDWIGATSKAADPIAAIFSILPYSRDSFFELPRGGLGYKSAISYLSTTIFFDGSEDMGAHLQITGQGCRALEASGTNVFALAHAIAGDDSFNFTRLDVACDTSFDILSPVVDSIAAGLYSSKSRKVTVISGASQSSALAASTVYIGSRSSRVFIRIYDKAKERGLAGVDWKRVELEIKQDYIIPALALFKQDKAKAFRNILGTYFRPLAKKIKPITRSPTAPYWEGFLGKIERISLFSAPEKPTVESKRAWLEKQVAPTMALLTQAYQDTAWLGDLAVKSVTRLKDPDWELIESYKEQ